MPGTLANPPMLGTLFLDRGGELGGQAGDTTCPVAVSRCTMAGSASAVLMSAAIRSRSGSGMSRGPNRPTSPSKVSSGRPACVTVGTPGRIAAGSVAVTAATLIRPGANLRMHDRIGRPVELQPALGHVGFASTRRDRECASCSRRTS